MKYGFVKIGVCTPKIKVADVEYNVGAIKNCLKSATDSGVEVIVFPELCVTGYTCGDLFFSDVLLNAAERGLIDIAKSTENADILAFVGLPVKKDGLIYNVAAAVNRGKVIGVIPKTFLPDYNEFYEKRWFAPANNLLSQIKIGDSTVPFARNVIFADKTRKNFTVAAEICEDLWSVLPPSASHAIAGANVIVNLSASNETVGKAEYRRLLVSGQSAKTVCAYAYADAGEGESTTDVVFAGHNIIAENGAILAESKLFSSGLTVAEIDLDYIEYERAKLFNYGYVPNGNYITVEFSVENEKTPCRKFSALPFVPNDFAVVSKRAELILEMQAEALKKRVLHTGAKAAVLGLSGGLDSTLAAIVAVSAMKKAGFTEKSVVTITMPCFGTSSRTYLNTLKLARALKTTLKKIDISLSVKRHLKDIDHQGEFDAAYENAQARERTQVIMDVANACGGIAVGTGDLSELALGWATYNGDHMSMYGVNSSIPKTLVRYLVKHFADKSKGKLKAVLYDILDTPVSPELLPAKDGEIAQKTEDIVGPYELHDFFLYHFIRRGSSPDKILALSKIAFSGKYDEEVIKKWLKTFIKRFFGQQFKRSCSPDGVKVGSVALSPRGDWRMPSDAVVSAWLDLLD